MGTRSVAVALWLALWACGAGPEVDPGQDTVDSGGPGDSTVELAWDATDGGGELPPPDAAPDGARDGAIESLDQEAADPCAADNGGCGDPDRVECLAVPGLGVQCLDRCDTDYPVLVAGVHSIDQGGAAPSLLVVHGPRACPLVADEAGRVLVAYTRAGSGRVVHAGHEALIVSPSGDAETLVLNLVRWLGGAPSPVVGIEAGTEGPQALLGAAGLSVIPGVGVGDLAAIDVLVTNSYVERSDEDLQALVGWVEGGGGLLQGGHAWWWSYSHDDVFGQYPGNRILNALGITVTASTDVSAGVEVLPAEGLPPLLHARRALHAVALHVAGEAPLPHEEQILAAATLVTAVSQLPLAFEAFFGPLRDVLAGIPAVCPTREEPVVPAEAPLDALVVSLLTKLALELPAGEVEPLPCDFPGPVPPDAEEVTRTLVLDASYPGLDPDYSFADAGDPLWLGTGLYAAPGRPVEVTASASWAGQGLSIRVSPFTDTLWGASSWTRFPEVSRSWPLEGVELTVASAFGGPIYLEVPGGVALGPGQVTFQGAVPMARYVHGETADFQEQLAAAPAPVVELEGDGLVLTVLREELSPAVEPEALMGFWGEVLAADAVLAALDGPRPRPERIAVDRQISAGWMHSGYPVMAYEWGGPLTDAGYLASEVEWGAFHELGHNHQYAPAVLPGTVEATCNLFSVYVAENVVGVDRSQAHPALEADERTARIDAYVAAGRDFWSDWNVWTALETYLQLQEAFGWELLIEMNALYLAMPDGTKPWTDADRIDRWVVHSSQAAGLSLLPFYLAWGFPVSPDAQAALAGLPPWDDHPMVPWGEP